MKPVTQPNLVKNYNNYMGGVDQHNWHLENYRIKVRSKKWYWCLFTRILDMAILNSCLLYSRINKNKLTSIEHRRNIARYKN